MTDVDTRIFELNKLIKRGKSNMEYMEQQYPNMDWTRREAPLSRSMRRGFNEYSHNKELVSIYEAELKDMT